MTAEAVGAGIAQRESRDPNLRYGVLDPACFKEDGGPSIEAARRIEIDLAPSLLQRLRVALRDPLANVFTRVEQALPDFAAEFILRALRSAGSGRAALLEGPTDDAALRFERRQAGNDVDVWWLSHAIKNPVSESRNLPSRRCALKLSPCPRQGFHLQRVRAHKSIRQVAEHVQPFDAVTLVSMACDGAACTGDQFEQDNVRHRARWRISPRGEAGGGRGLGR
jgi:hypothetical protein